MTTTSTPATNKPATSTTAVPYISPGLSALVTQLVFTDAKRAVAWYEKAFGAKLLHSMPTPEGGIMHGALSIGEAVLFVNDVVKLGAPTKANSYLHLRDIDAVYERAVAAGAKVLMPLQNMFWGDRYALIEDPFGNQWQLAKHIEDVSPEEMQRRMAAQASS